MMHDQERDYSTRVKARKKHRKLNKAALARPAAEFKGLVRKEGWPMVLYSTILPFASVPFRSHTLTHIFVCCYLPYAPLYQT